MIKLIVIPPRHWEEGEILKIKVIRVAQTQPGIWELVIEEVKEVQDDKRRV